MKRLCLILAYLFLFSQTASAMPLLVGQKVVYRGTITGLRIGAADGGDGSVFKALVDNLSGTLALANSPLLHTGALTQANTRISAAATFAFIDTNDATFATNLAAHLGKYLVIKDSAGKKAYAWIKAAGASETLGDDLLSGWDLTSGWTLSGDATIISSNSFSSTGYAGCYKSYTTALRLYKGSLSCTATGSVYLRTASGFNYATKIAEAYATASGGTVFIMNDYAGTTSNIVMTLKQVLTPSASGATLSSTKNGTAMDNWESIETGFNYNDSSGYTYYIYGRDITDIADGNHQIEIYDSSNRMLKGVLKAAGTSESAVTDVLAGWDFTSGWSLSPNTTIDDSNTFTSSISIGGVYRNALLTAGALYKMSLDGSTTGTSIVWRDGGSSVNYLSAPSTDKYITALDTGVRLRSTSAGTTDITTLSAYLVTAPSSSGATITTLKNGDVYNWSYKNSSFTYNASSYYVIIRAIR